MTLYAVGIGGTGAKCLEALTQLAATGYFTLLGGASETVKLLFVDPDETNGSLTRARESIGFYHNCFQEGTRSWSKWMCTPIEDLGLWSPFSGTQTDKTLKDFYSYEILKENEKNLTHLFNILYTEEERQAELDVGFRGRPAIGSAVMSRVNLNNLNEGAWRNLLANIKADNGAGKSSSIVFFGSIFGGTGASGVPTLGRLLKNKLEAEKLKGQVTLSSVFILPYFRFSPTAEQERSEKVYASSDHFLLNTEAALRYYKTEAESIFDRVYLIGNQSQSEVDFSVGKQTQKNAAHFVEVFAALAAADSLQQQQAILSEQGKASFLGLVSRENRDQIGWGDLPNGAQVQSSLMQASRFAYVWLSNISPELKRAREVGVTRFRAEAPWFSTFYNPEGRLFGGGKERPKFGDASEQSAIRIVDDWCKDFVRWLQEVHDSQEEMIQLVDTRLLAGLVGEKLSEADQLANLILGQSVEKGQKQSDTIFSLRVKLENPPKEFGGKAGNGTMGLAKTLYNLV